MIKIKCLNCESENTKYFTSGKDRLYKISNEFFNYYRCTDCNNLFMHPQISKECLPDFYPKNYGPYDEGNTIFANSSILNFLKILFKKKNNSLIETERKVYLDYGCGSGNSLQKLKTSHPNYELHGFDMSEDVVENLKQKGIIGHTGYLKSKTLKENYFDIIYTNQVIEHVYKPVEMVNYLVSLLKKDGKLVISTPNADSPILNIFKTYYYALEAPRHISILNKKTLTGMLIKNAVMVTEINYSNSPKVFLQSLNYVIFNRPKKINPIIYKLLTPLFSFLAKRGKTDNIEVVGVKK